MGGTIEQARAAVGAGDFGRAAALARALLAQSQDDVHALEVLFLCQQEAGDRPGAEATLRRTIALAPDKQWPRGDLARLLIAGDRQADAERVLCDAVEADPG